MAWQDVDLTARYWRIPETKSGSVVVVPLVPAAVEVLQARHKANGSSPWVFPAKSASGHLSEPWAAWRRLLKRAGLSDLRIHDLRRSLGSWQAIGGSSLPIIGKSLGHSQPSTTAIYARLSMDPVRSSVESATAAMLTHGRAAVGSGGMVIDVSSAERGGRVNRGLQPYEIAAEVGMTSQGVGQVLKEMADSPKLSKLTDPHQDFDAGFHKGCGERSSRPFFRFLG